MISKEALINKINLTDNIQLTKDYFLKALKNEILIWKQLKHSNIVAFRDLSETKNNIYFLLEYCSGGQFLSNFRNLGQYLKNNALITQSEAISIFDQLTKACEYLYDKKIFHRDIKPENVLYSSTGIHLVSTQVKSNYVILDSQKLQQMKKLVNKHAWVDFF